MKFVLKDEVARDYFPVVDSELARRVDGLTTGLFQTSLYGPDGTTSLVPVTLSPLPNGLFSIEFTPDEAGTWILNIDHPDYFPYGKSESYHSLESMSGAFVPEGETFYDGVVFVDLVNGERVGGLTDADVTISLYGPDGSTSSVPVHFEEISNKIYRTGFQPDEVGRWVLNIDSSTYFPYGKSSGYDAGTHSATGDGTTHYVLTRSVDVSQRTRSSTVSRTARESDLSKRTRTGTVERTARYIEVSRTRTKRTITVSQ